MGEYVLNSSEVTPRLEPAVGGKAMNLARLRAIIDSIPSWYVITTHAFRAFLQECNLAERINQRLADLREDDVAAAGREIRGWLTEPDLPERLRLAILELHGELLHANAWVAVRSSAVGEDAVDRSFAGLHDSFLFIRRPTELLDHVQKVWASAFNERALSYRLKHDLPLHDIAVAVVVQQMVEPSVSGVMFTADPVAHQPYRIVINSVFGAGEGLVSAGFEADAYRVDKRHMEIESELALKTRQLMLNDTGSGLQEEDVPRASQTDSSLKVDQVTKLARLGVLIENHFRRPQDIEFVIDWDDHIYILQSRPITGLPEYGPAAGNRQVWDNSNIIESYSGVTTPMTFSFIRRAYTIVYHCFAEVMGIPDQVVRDNQPVFENMLGLIRGQVYYNLPNWYRLVRLFPGYHYNKSFMESMMGVSEPLDLEEDNELHPSFRRKWLVELPNLLALVVRVGGHFRRIDRLVGDFQTYFDHHYDRWARRSFHRQPLHELMQIYRQMEDTLLWHWKPPIINDFYVMVYYGVLKQLCQRWCGDQTGSLQNGLLCGEGGIVSTEPTRQLIALANQAREQPDLVDWLRQTPPDEAMERLRREPRFSSFREQLETYLATYGSRCINELKLEEPTLKEEPAFVFQMLGNYLQMDDPAALDLDAMATRERQTRRDAEDQAMQAIGGLLGWPRRRLFRFVLKRARRGVRNRENMRFLRTRIYGLLRELLVAAGEELHHEGLIDSGDDVFYLTIDELWDFVKGTAVTTNLRALVALRQEEFAAYREHPENDPADRFETFGMVCHRNRYQPPPEPDAEPRDGDLKGTPCCPGTVSGPVKVVRAPTDNLQLNGEILVAGRTDPGWVPLYPSISGLLIERGSILSHSAIVAREMGIPTIVGIPGLLDQLASGDKVSMDAAAGTVTIEPR